jgi:tetratricopeptide (TPR) repeat protein
MIMDMKKIYQYFRVCLLGILIGCGESFLTRPPLNQISESSFWKTEKDAISGVTAIYDALQMDLGYRLGMMVFGDVVGDDANSFDVDWFAHYDNFTVNASDPQVLRAWRAWWAGVARANAVLAHVPGIPMNEEVKARSLNEAKFLRGVCYFNMVTIWGDVPLIVGELNQEQLNSVTRQSKDLIWAQIEKDFSDAEALPLQYPATEAGRATKGAAKAFLARSYLYQAKYQQALDKAKEVIDLNVYDLHNEYIKNFQTAFENGLESVFEVQFISGTGGWGNNEGNWVPQFTGPPGNYVPTSGYGIIIPEASHKKAYEANDKRRAVNIFEKGSVYNNTPYDTTWSPTGVSMAKYIVGDPPVSTEGPIDAERNTPVIRYAEVLLTYAEALNEVGRTAEAEPFLNKVRTRAGLTSLSALTQAAFRDAILRERRIEFFGEGHRFFDLRRTGNLDQFVRVTAGKFNFTQPKNLYFPLPQSDRDLNPGLSQNAGY